MDVSWQDEHSRAVLRTLDTLPERHIYSREAIHQLLEADYTVGLTIIRLALDLSKDEFELQMRGMLGGGSAGVKRFQSAPDTYMDALVEMGILKSFRRLTAKPVTWRDILVERLKLGRGTAIKGQVRGRQLEDFTEAIVSRVFHDVGYAVRCRFVGSSGESTEKADFAIPSKTDPAILIETKAYGATGSKQTDILGEISRIVAEKRHDTHLLLVTDGITWRARVSDLRKLVALQNEGKISRIYTQQMAAELEGDLRQLRQDHHL